ncbi:TLC domain-containing protein [Zea mays]|uniref:TLC domain-containing protein n=1 Tax=Zea mays TaxID=4577 RepID=A0A3L6EQF6_MAIZE|nr:TLC domain-containing protein [Zea mays]
MDLLASLAAEERWLFPAFLAMYAAIYCAGQLVVFRRWAPRQRLDGASCLISLFHGTPAALAAAGAILALPAGSRSFAAPNARLQDHVLDYSVAYFTMDLLHYLAFLPGDVLFIAHHLATLFVFLTCRYLVRHGAYALLVLLVLAEVTSLLQNVWTLAGIWRDQSPAAARVYGALSPPFYALYTLVRGVAGPLFLLKMAAFYLSGQAVDVIPWWVRISWILVVGTAIAVSNLWIWNLWKELVREWKQQAPPKSKKDT